MNRDHGIGYPPSATAGSFNLTKMQAQIGALSKGTKD